VQTRGGVEVDVTVTSAHSSNVTYLLAIKHQLHFSLRKWLWQCTDVI